jgi:hypothetical protein
LEKQQMKEQKLLEKQQMKEQKLLEKQKKLLEKQQKLLEKKQNTVVTNSINIQSYNEEEPLQNDYCIAILKTGIRKGEQCNCKKVINNLCNRHNKMVKE